jgi:hypothetical protein
MPNHSASSDRPATWPLIAVPSVITLAVTLLRLLGELEHWSKAFFNPAGGGGGAIVGITWLAPVFGIYFAVNLVRAGQGPPSASRAVIFAVLGAAIVVAGFFLPGILSRFSLHEYLLCLWANLALAALLTLPGWRALFKVLLAYAYAARIPVAVIMLLAFIGHWGTHYDAAPPNVSFASVWTEFLWLGFFPQLIFWVGYTIVAGTLCGSIVAALIDRRGSPARSPSQAVGSAS